MGPCGSRARVAQIVFTARRAGIKFHSLSNHDASALTFRGAIALKAPKFLVTRGVLVRHRVAESLNNAICLVRLAFLSEIQLPGSVDIHAVLVVAHHVA